MNSQVCACTIEVFYLFFKKKKTLINIKLGNVLTLTRLIEYLQFITKTLEWAKPLVNSNVQKSIAIM